MSEVTLKTVVDNISEAHARIQQVYANLNPVIEVRRGMRDGGFPADVITIDCFASRRRILLILHDEKPGLVLYQFSIMDVEMAMDFAQISLNNLNVEVLYEWIESYFLKGNPI